MATLIYTSGTTGEPKGVMLTHGNIASNVTTCVQLFTFSEEDECLSFLPLSHIFERMFGHFCMFDRGVVINYAESVDTVAADMQQLAPHAHGLGTPALREDLRPRARQRARGLEDETANLLVGQEDGRDLGGPDHREAPRAAGLAAQRWLADRLVFAKLRKRTGGRIRFFISGGAPLAPEIARFFHAAEIPILEGYGLTETSPVIAVNTFKHLRLGTVGLPIPGVEVKIAPDGEIITRGPNVMTGYYKKPEATAEVIDAEGWFHTGDIGLLDADGFLRSPTGRRTSS